MADRDKQEQAGREKVVQYLEEARAMELALVQTLTAHIAVTPRSAYRTELEKHLEQTHAHSERVSRRLDQLGEGKNPVAAGLGAVQAAAGQVIVAAKAPVDLLRGAGAAEKLLKNAKDESVSEQLEIATYVSIQRLAESVGDSATARLASSIRQEERRMLTVLGQEIERLTVAMVRQDVRGEKVFDLSTVGAADAVRKLAVRGKRASASTARSAKRATGSAKRAAASTAKTARRQAGVTTREARRGARRTASSAARGSRKTAASARRGASRTTSSAS